MCGIVALFNYHCEGAVSREQLRRVRDHMRSRGPDGKGEWVSPDARAALGHRRLAIIDLTESGAQPMESHDGALAIAYNGEIYNYRELRDDLEKRGATFHSSSDTEVLLHLYREKGEKMLAELRGMYAFALWDEEQGELFCARDPFGIKPLYYSDDGGTLRAASQVKALLAGGEVDSSPEPAGHAGFFLWGHVPEPFTLYRGIRSLQAGHWMLVRRDGMVKTQAFSSLPKDLARSHASARGDERSPAALRRALLDSVRAHFVADVPVGLFLSSGIDSCTLAALAVEAGVDLQTITVGFEEYRGTENDETPLAEETARALGVTHRTVRMGKGDYLDEADRFLCAMDQPTTDGLNSWFVSRAAAGAGLKAALSGLGGDELFGGYPSFRQVPRAASLLHGAASVPGLGRAARRTAAPLLGRFTSPKYAGLLEYGDTFGGAYLLRRALYMPWEIPALIGEELAGEGLERLRTVPLLDETAQGLEPDRLKVSALEMAWYMRGQLLRDTDWASMAHSLEVRVPFVDMPLARMVAGLVGNNGFPSKSDLAAAAGKALPAAVTSRRKTGFTVPVRQWLMEESGVSAERGLRGWSQVVYRSFQGAQ